MLKMSKRYWCIHGCGKSVYFYKQIKVTNLKRYGMYKCLRCNKKIKSRTLFKFQLNTFRKRKVYK